MDVGILTCVQASIYMPPLRVLRNIIDRMKNLSNFVRVSANNAGELKLCVETDLVNVSTYFHDLDRPLWREFDYQGYFLVLLVS